MEDLILTEKLSKELGIAHGTVKARLNKIGSHWYIMGRRACTVEDAEKVKNFRQLYRQGLKQEK